MRLEYRCRARDSDPHPDDLADAVRARADRVNTDQLVRAHALGSSSFANRKVQVVDKVFCMIAGIIGIVVGITTFPVVFAILPLVIGGVAFGTGAVGLLMEGL